MRLRPEISMLNNSVTACQALMSKAEERVLKVRLQLLEKDKGRESDGRVDIGAVGDGGCSGMNNPSFVERQKVVGDQVIFTTLFLLPGDDEVFARRSQLSSSQFSYNPLTPILLLILPSSKFYMDSDADDASSKFAQVLIFV
ncbi:hypothetical protein DFJ58DRAFT_850246 [Suillus subalutaceus]|uniref:uncharacterized protein n=1 Tax=Suillus subalutaceus TaxID=48586 RepID=UPI001B878F5E|nr:uncharacterized protein DFJ58DRAFT_850246 [Suillus subalutaceus]KAG1818356.1 hypothetical protein DFJ58DRAFT_850246 [Suillus subalutaceus]